MTTIDPLTDDVAHTIDAFIWQAGVRGPQVAALAVLGRPRVVEALEALDLLERLRAEHRWQQQPDSTWRNCSCNVAGCHAPDLLNP